MIKYFGIALCVFLFIGSEQSLALNAGSSALSTGNEPPISNSAPEFIPFLRIPVKTILVENAPEAIPTWREFSPIKPALVLLSQNPFLMPIPAQLKKEASQLVYHGTLQEFKTKATRLTANPVLLPGMALRAALESHFFSKIIWVLQNGDAKNSVSLKAFLEILINSGVATTDEANQFVQEKDIFSGRIGKTPILIVPWYTLKKIDQPVIVHFDLSFFKSRYQNEIKTPIYELTRTILRKLRETISEVYTVTVSSSHQSGKISLEVRFLRDFIARIFTQPELLNRPLKKNDARLRKALYLENFFQKERVRKLYLAMEKESPADASVAYHLYLNARQFKQGGTALKYLKQAVALDDIYALEYLTLAPLALEKGRPDEAQRMLELAAKAFPQNPFILLRQAELAVMQRQKNVATQLLKRLEKLSWSEIFHPQVPGLITSLKSANSNTPESRERRKEQ